MTLIVTLSIIVDGRVFGNSIITPFIGKQNILRDSPTKLNGTLTGGGDVHALYYLISADSSQVVYRSGNLLTLAGGLASKRRRQY